jgi:hypothetical protein
MPARRLSPPLWPRRCTRRTDLSHIPDERTIAASQPEEIAQTIGLTKSGTNPPRSGLQLRGLVCSERINGKNKQDERL